MLVDQSFFSFFCWSLNVDEEKFVINLQIIVVQENMIYEYNVMKKRYNVKMYFGSCW